MATLISQLSRLNWVSAVLFPLTVIFTEALWVYPWLIRIGSWPVFRTEHTPLSLASVILLLGGSFFITRFFTRRRWALKWTRLSILACGLVTVLAVLRTEYPADRGLMDAQWFIYISRLLIDSFSHPNQVLAALLVGLYLWLRGIGLGHSPLFFENAYRYFSVGLIAQVALIIAWGADTQNSFMANAGLYVAGFFFFGLSAMALAKLKGTQEQGKAGGINAVFNGQWLSIILVVITGIVLVGIGAASIFSPNFLSVLGTLFNLVSGILFKVVYYILTVFVTIVGFVIGILLYIIQSIINMLQGKPPAESVLSGNLTAIEGLKQGVSRDLSPETMLVIKWTLFAVVIAAMVFFIIRSIQRHRPARTKEDVEETNESLWSWSGFLTDLRLFFSFLWQCFRGKIKKVLPGAVSALSRRHTADITGRFCIREVYQHLLLQASKFGVTRRRQETPFEYSKRFGQSLPEGSAYLTELTDLYVNVRYGEIKPEEKQEDKANSLWQAIKRLLSEDKTDQT